MIALLSCSIDLLASDNDDISSTGGLLHKDSVCISIDDIRKANAKMIEAKYLKVINAKQDTIVNNYKNLNNQLTNKNKIYKKQRNIAIGATILFIIISIFK